jgi:hypothetical protein
MTTTTAGTVGRRVAAGAPDLRSRAAYLKRVASVYLFRHRGPLSFWYETPEVNADAFGLKARGSGLKPPPGHYYMTFAGKARYPGPFDADGVPLLDYRGDIGVQANPIAIAQYGLACLNQFFAGAHDDARSRAISAANWLVRNLESTREGVPVWHHHFDWPYRQLLKAPWRSGLAQGCGVSLLVRIAVLTDEQKYADAAREAFKPLTLPVADGGVLVRDGAGSLWIEEYLVDPPTHILNGFIWALWGVYDFARWRHDPVANAILDASLRTLIANLPRYDTGNWSLYELGDDDAPMLASPYYHQLHIVQLRALHLMTGRREFAECADRWEAYAASRVKRNWALARKVWFKLRRY